MICLGSCNYVECVAATWSPWSADCGKATRSRVMQTISRTVERYSCDGLKKTCPTTTEQQSRTKLCKT